MSGFGILAFYNIGMHKIRRYYEEVWFNFEILGVRIEFDLLSISLYEFILLVSLS